MVTGLPTIPRAGSALVSRWSLVPLRVYLGAAFLRAALNKIGENWQHWPGWMAEGIRAQLAHSIPGYNVFLANVILPHVGFFAPAVACTEVSVGTCLLLGLGTRAAGLVGALLTFNYLLYNGLQPLLPGSQLVYVFGSNDPIFVMGCAAVCIGAAGRIFGLDWLLHRRFPRLIVA